MSETTNNSANAGQQLRELTTGCRLRLSKLGTRRALEQEQVDTVAGQFDAEARRLSASKVLFNTRHPKWRACRDVLQAAKSYWLMMTLPYVDPGTRLLRRARAAEFSAYVSDLQGKLALAVDELQDVRGELLEQARAELGSLFNAGDFPTSFAEHFAIEHEFVSVDPPSYLQQLAPEVYERECRRVQAAFEQSAVLAEQSFADSLLDLVTRLRESLEPAPEGKKKRIHESGLEGLREFTERFRQLSVGGNAQLDSLVGECEQLVAGKQIKTVREDGALRREMASTLADVTQRLAGLVVEQPERRLRTRVKPQEQPAEAEEVAA